MPFILLVFDVTRRSPNHWVYYHYYSQRSGALEPTTRREKLAHLRVLARRGVHEQDDVAEFEMVPAARALLCGHTIAHRSRNPGV